MGISPSMLGKIERGERGLTEEQFRAIDEALVFDDDERTRVRRVWLSHSADDADLAAATAEQVAEIVARLDRQAVDLADLRGQVRLLTEHVVSRWGQLAADVAAIRQTLTMIPRGTGKTHLGPDT